MLDNLDLKRGAGREQLLIGQRCDGDVVIVLARAPSFFLPALRSVAAINRGYLSPSI
jgi:hypothetical protein